MDDTGENEFAKVAVLGDEIVEVRALAEDERDEVRWLLRRLVLDPVGLALLAFVLVEAIILASENLQGGLVWGGILAAVVARAAIRAAPYLLLRRDVALGKVLVLSSARGRV